MQKALAALCGAVALVSSAAFAAPADDIAACQKDAAAWKDAYNRHDAEALANMYDASAGMFSNDFWTATGHDALLAGFKQMLAGFGGSMTSITCEHAAPQGDGFVMNGTWSAVGKAPDGKNISLTGHFMTLSRNGVIVTHLANEQRQPPPK